MTVIFDMAREIYVSRLAFTSAEAILDFRYYQKPNTPATAEAWLEANFGRKRNSRRTCVSDRMHWLYQLSLSSISVKWIMFFPLATIVILIILVFSFFYLYVAAVLSPNVSVTAALEAIDLHTNDQEYGTKSKTIGWAKNILGNRFFGWFIEYIALDGEPLSSSNSIVAAVEAATRESDALHGLNDRRYIFLAWLLVIILNFVLLSG